MGTKGIEGGKRADAWRVDPMSLVVDEGNNYSRFAVQEDRVDVIAASILEHGQLQPVSVWLDAERRPHLLAGFHRYLAVVKINSTLPPDRQLMLLAVTVQPGNELDRELENIAENAATATLTAMDFAKQVRRLLCVHGKTPAEIAGIYGRTQGWVSQVKALNRLTPEIQLALHKGEFGMTLSRGYALSKLASNEQEAAFAALKAAWTPEPEIEEEDSGDADSPEGTPAPKKSKARKANDALRAAGATSRRSASEMRGELEACSGFSPFCNLALDFWSGAKEVEQFRQELEALESLLPHDEDGNIVLPVPIAPAVASVSEAPEAPEAIPHGTHCISVEKDADGYRHLFAATHCDGCGAFHAINDVGVKVKGTPKVGVPFVLDGVERHVVATFPGELAGYVEDVDGVLCDACYASYLDAKEEKAEAARATVAEAALVHVYPPAPANGGDLWEGIDSEADADSDSEDSDE